MSAVTPICVNTWDILDRVSPTFIGRPILDIGANHGSMTEKFLAYGASKVVAVEPSPANVAILEKMFAGQSKVLVKKFGVSSAPGQLEGVTFLNCWTLGKPGAYGLALSPGARAVEPNPFDVELRTIDDIVVELGLPDVALVKIDTDGYDFRALKGCAATLARFRPYVLIELCYLIRNLGDDVNAFIAYIYDIGYQPATMDGRLISREQLTAHFPWHTSCDVLLIPNEACGDLPKL